MFIKLNAFLWVDMMDTMTVTQLPTDMTSADAHALLTDDKITIIDVRTPMEWQRTGLAEKALTVSTQDSAFMDKLSEAVGGDTTKPIGLICATGNRSGMVQRYLLQNGYSNVSNISDGMMGNFAAPGWIRSNLPLTPYEG